MPDPDPQTYEIAAHGTATTTTSPAETWNNLTGMFTNPRQAPWFPVFKSIALIATKDPIQVGTEFSAFDKHGKQYNCKITTWDPGGKRFGFTVSPALKENGHTYIISSRYEFEISAAENGDSSDVLVRYTSQRKEPEGILTKIFGIQANPEPPLMSVLEKIPNVKLFHDIHTTAERKPLGRRLAEFAHNFN